MTDAVLSLAVEGVPGPKGSVNAFCVRCAKRGLPQSIVVKEQSDTGVAFRRRIAMALRSASVPNHIWEGAVETRLTVFIARRIQIKNGKPTGEPVPSHRTPAPRHQQSGDAEKHVRVLHDALQDAGIIADDCQVIRQSSEKRWADGREPGIEFEVIFLEDL